MFNSELGHHLTETKSSSFPDLDTLSTFRRKPLKQTTYGETLKTPVSSSTVYLNFAFYSLTLALI